MNRSAGHTPDDHGTRPGQGEVETPKFIGKSQFHDPFAAQSSRLFWATQTGGWIFIALFGFLARTLTFNDMHVALTLTLLLDSIGFLLTAAAHVFFLSKINRIISPAVIAAMVGFAFVAGMAQMQIAEFVRLALFPDAQMAIRPALPFVFYVSVLLGWTLAYFCMRTYIEARTERLRRSEAQASAMRFELDQLRHQLAPHFLFNALNSVASEIHERPDIALEMVRRIAGYLRFCLDQKTASLCPLSEELEAMRTYMRIQEIRFEDKLRCTVRVAPSVNDVLVPHMILQGLVENAVKHGLKQKADRIDITVSAQRPEGDTIVITVTNSGELAPPDNNRPAIGLANLQQRLNLHYPQAHAFSLNQIEHQVVARIILKGPACHV